MIHAVTAVLAMLVVSVLVSFAGTNNAHAELLEDQLYARASTYGRYAYSAFLLTSDDSDGPISGLFEYYNGSTWEAIEPMVYVSDSWDMYETDAHGSTTGTLVYNYRSTIRPVQMPLWGFDRREGDVFIYANIP